jgi:hypothetical protein
VTTTGSSRKSSSGGSTNSFTPLWPDVRREHVGVVAGEHVVGR